MGEHKLREEKNGDEKQPLSTHIVECEDFGGMKVSDWAESIEDMYKHLNARAKADDSVILSVVQNINVYVSEGRLGQVVTLTAQRMSREDLERQQRAMQIASGGPRR